jgi:hypothetical protein
MVSKFYRRNHFLGEDLPTMQSGFRRAKLQQDSSDKVGKNIDVIEHHISNNSSMHIGFVHMH